jgi:hypothetical protein
MAWQGKTHDWGSSKRKGPRTAAARVGGRASAA